MRDTLFKYEGYSDFSPHTTNLHRSIQGLQNIIQLSGKDIKLKLRLKCITFSLL